MTFQPGNRVRIIGIFNRGKLGTVTDVGPQTRLNFTVEFDEEVPEIGKYCNFSEKELEFADKPPSLAEIQAEILREVAKKHPNRTIADRKTVKWLNDYANEIILKG